MTRIIGIDLGTTNCCAAVFVDGKPVVVANKAGYKTTPSVVGIGADGKTVVGQLAVRQSVTNAKHTAYAVKRLLGRPFQSPEVQHAREHVGYPIVAGPGGEPRIVLRGREYSPQEVSAILLSEMRFVAEESLRESIEKAIVTVPAHFNDSQRQAVRDAGKIAGLDVVRIINEPTAAAVAFGFGKGLEKTLAVYDLGGGTFDVSIVRCMADGTFKVLATTGDSFLGGEDFDERIMGWLLDGFEAEHGIAVRDNALVVHRVREAATKAKHDLSAVPRTEIQLPFLVNGTTGPVSMHYEITRETLDALTVDLVERTVAICEHALASISMAPSAIDEVVLVGGMTRMPLVVSRVEALFGRKASKGVHPDEAVAIGAAIQGAALADEIGSIALEDVTSQPIGIAVAGDRFAVLIPANSRVPVAVTRRVSTSKDDQPSVRVRVLQGTSQKASENELLHEFELGPLRKGKAGSIAIEVTFSIDADGMFEVTGRDVATGHAVSARVTGDSGLSDEDIQRLRDEHQRAADGRRTDDMLASMRQAVEIQLAEITRLVAALEREGLGERPIVATYRERANTLRPQLMAHSRSDLAELAVELEDARDQLDSIASSRT